MHFRQKRWLHPSSLMGSAMNLKQMEQSRSTISSSSLISSSFSSLGSSCFFSSYFYFYRSSYLFSSSCYYTTGSYSLNVTLFVVLINLLWYFIIGVKLLIFRCYNIDLRNYCVSLRGGYIYMVDIFLFILAMILSNLTCSLPSLSILVSAVCRYVFDLADCIESSINEIKFIFFYLL